jgi:hypothetical protein
VASEQHTADLTQQYKQLSADYEQLRQIIIDIRSQMDGMCAPSFLLYGLGND